MALEATRNWFQFLDPSMLLGSYWCLIIHQRGLKLKTTPMAWADPYSILMFPLRHTFKISLYLFFALFCINPNPWLPVAWLFFLAPYFPSWSVVMTRITWTQHEPTLMIWEKLHIVGSDLFRWWELSKRSNTLKYIKIVLVFSLY